MKTTLKQLISNTTHKLQLTTDLLRSSKDCELDLQREQYLYNCVLSDLYMLECKLKLMIKDAKECPNVLIDDLVN